MSFLMTDDVLRAAEAWLGERATPDRVARVAWSVVTEPGDSAAGALIANLGSAQALAEAGRAIASSDGTARSGAGSRPGYTGLYTADGRGTGRDLLEAVERWRARWDPALIVDALSAAGRRGMHLVIPEDAGWHRGFDDLGAHAPVALWVQGDPVALGADGPAVGLVGARAATPYGEHVTADIASSLAADGVTLISGAAYGIDGAAHRAALTANAVTIAFVAGGADRVYPAGHANLLSRIAASGAIVAERPPGSAPTKWRFLARNRLIAARSAATVVVEAGARSGALNTAGHAATLARPLGTVPGPVTSATSAGCHRVLREYDAVCVTCADDVRELVGLRVDHPLSASGDPTSTRVADALTRNTPRGVEEISRLSGVAPAEVTAALGLLTLSGTAAETARGWLLTPA